MTAKQLIHQYDSGAITPRGFVESVWESTETQRDEIGQWYFFTCNALHRAFFTASIDMLYRLAAAFTLSRLEEIRQVKEEIDVLENARCGTWDLEGYDALDRILARERAHLETNCKGIKKEALA